MLREIAHRTKARTGSTKLSAVDYMDDGSPIALDVEIDEEKVILVVFVLIRPRETLSYYIYNHLLDLNCCFCIMNYASD